MFGIKRRFSEKAERPLTGPEISRFAGDVDRLWLSSAIDEIDDSDYIEELSKLSTEEAIDSLTKELDNDNETKLEARLGSLGIALGELTPNKGIPSGAVGIWRTGVPMILLRPDVLKASDGGYKISKAIGSLLAINGTVDETRIADELADRFTTISPTNHPEVGVKKRTALKHTQSQQIQ